MNVTDLRLSGVLFGLKYWGFECLKQFFLRALSARNLVSALDSGLEHSRFG